MTQFIHNFSPINKDKHDTLLYYDVQTNNILIKIYDSFELTSFQHAS